MSISEFIFHYILSVGVGKSEALGGENEGIFSYRDMLTARYPSIIPITMGRRISLCVYATMILLLLQMVGIVDLSEKYPDQNFAGFGSIFEALLPLYGVCFAIGIINYLLTIIGVASILEAIIYVEDKKARKTQITDTICVVLFVWFILFPMIGYIRPISGSNEFRVKQETYYVGETLYVSENGEKVRKEVSEVIKPEKTYEPTVYIFTDGTSKDEDYILGQVLEKDKIWIIKGWYCGLRNGLYGIVFQKVLPEWNL